MHPVQRDIGLAGGYGVPFRTVLPDDQRMRRIDRTDGPDCGADPNREKGC